MNESEKNNDMSAIVDFDISHVHNVHVTKSMLFLRLSK